MKDYRAISSDDEQAWPLKPQENLGLHIFLIILLVMGFVLTAGLIVFKR